MKVRRKDRFAMWVCASTTCRNRGSCIYTGRTKNIINKKQFHAKCLQDRFDLVLRPRGTMFSFIFKPKEKWIQSNEKELWTKIWVLGITAKNQIVIHTNNNKTQIYSWFIVKITSASQIILKRSLIHEELGIRSLYRSFDPVGPNHFKLRSLQRHTRKAY